MRWKKNKNKNKKTKKKKRMIRNTSRIYETLNNKSRS